MNKKLYVITEGAYSDYHIVCIFEDKEKAYNYVKYHQGGWDSSYVEEYDLADDDYKLISNGYYKVSGSINISKEGCLEELRVFYNCLTDTSETSSSLGYEHYYYTDTWKLNLMRSFPESSIHSEDEPAEKLIHILKDTASQIADLRSQGYSIEEIREMRGFEK